MLEFHTLDVFTQTPFSGNPLAVVMGADDLNDQQMQMIAREFNLSETIFVQKPRNPANTARVRIFLTTVEIPFAGHPTIGCAMHLACAQHKGDFVANIVLEGEAGLVPVTVSRKHEQIEAEFTAPVLPFAIACSAPDDLVAKALGLTSVGFSAHRPGLFQGGPRFFYLPVASLNDLALARPSEPAWSSLIQHTGALGAYIYATAEDCDFRARMFSQSPGMAEDPATGSASAILAAQLLNSGALKAGTNLFMLRQGVEMGRASTIHLTVDMGTTLQSVRIRGSAVPISSGGIVVPDLANRA